MALFFSSNTNILWPPQLPIRCFAPSSSKTLSTLQFPPVINNNNNNKHLNNCFNTNTALTADPGIETPGWAEFAAKVSGEWDGFGADFTVEGKPIELPESVVPEAYREWEVKVFDWQTQCPTLASQSNNNNCSFIYKTIKLLPTVGCEADAATTYSIQERHITTSSAPLSHHNYSSAAAASAFAYHQSTGSYVALWPPIHLANNNTNSNNKSLMELEHCLINPSNKESRVRIIQLLELQESRDLKLKSISVFVESWYGPFRNGDQLGGCAVRDSAFATTQPLKASQVSGGLLWEALTAHVATFAPPPPTSHNMIQELVGDDECAHKSIRDEGDLILLPKQLWCSLKRDAEYNTTRCEVGWLLDEGRAITSKCTFSSTALVKEISLASEKVTPM